MPKEIRKIKIKMRTYENTKDEVQGEVKIAPSDIMRWKVDDKDELKTFEKVSTKIKMRTS